MEQLKGYITKKIFYNKENGFGIVVVEVEGNSITCKGVMIELNIGECVTLDGNYVEDKKYGRQFQIVKVNIEAPGEEEGVYRYLASGAIKGIKEGLARKICDLFLEDALRIIDEEPERLAEVKGISLKKAREIGIEANKNKKVREVLLFLQSFEISNVIAMRIYEKYKAQTYQIVQNNPYQLIQTIDGISFTKAELIAQKAGIMVDDELRIQSAILYLMKEITNAGDSFVFETKLIAKAAVLLRLEVELIKLQLNNLCMDKELIGEIYAGEKVYYLPRTYRVEMECARQIYDLANPLDSELGCVTLESSKRIFEMIEVLAAENRIELEELQQQAIYKSIVNPFTIITGGPGTGKTTIIKMIIQYFREKSKDVFLAAPTGRAAKRMTEATGYKAKTIHRMLEAMGSVKEGQQMSIFNRNEMYVLEADVIVIDEMSMVDLYLMQALLRAIPMGTQVILVGDTDQLPSIGPGQVLLDIIKSGVCEVISLQKIYRQAEESGIIKNAHLVKEGKNLDVTNGDGDMIFYEECDMIKIKQYIKKCILCEKEKKDGKEIQVLTPTRGGELGVVELNKFIQLNINPAKEGKNELEMNDILFREGDKVIQQKNNYQLGWKRVTPHGICIEQGLGVFNGDIGVVQKINPYAQSIEVAFEDGHMVIYEKSDIDELDLAYAITIHKAQGSEYSIVIIPLMNVPIVMCYKNLLYTGITRAKNNLVVVGSKKVAKNMIENKQIKTRNTSLGEFIVQFIEQNNIPM